MARTVSASSGTPYELLADAAVAERHRAADPDALALGGRDLVAHPFADHLPFELGEGEQHVEGQPAHAARRVERLRHDTKDTPCRSNNSTSLAKSASDRVSRSTL